MKTNENKKKAIILTIVAVSCLLIVVFGAAPEFNTFLNKKSLKPSVYAELRDFYML